MAEEIMAASQGDDAEDFAAMLAAHEAVAPSLQQGQKVTGTVISIAGDNVFVDVGFKLDGIMDRKDILDAEGKESVVVGDSVEAWVVGVSSGEIRLSRSMSGSGIAALEDARDAALPVDGRITNVCKGGYTVDVMGKAAFCPGSQIGIYGVDDPTSLIGRCLQFLIIRVENHGRNVVVSHRALLEREHKENLEKVLEQIKPGDNVEGKITRIAPFGVFVELAPSVEGMIHLSELSWSHVTNVDAAVSMGEVVRVKVLAIDRDAKGRVRISLSRKQAEGDPWEHVGDHLVAGSVVQGKVVRLVPFGAFVELLPGVEGLAHISELSWAKHITKPEDVLNVGENLTVKIKDIDLQTRRISLSVRDAEGDPWQDVERLFPVGSTVSGTVESIGRYGMFVALAPGVTGLLPDAVIKSSKTGKQYSVMDKGDTVTLTVQKLDIAARRISLAPEGMDVLDTDDDNAWKQHSRVGVTQETGMTVMAQALQKALQKK
ncbi:MAG: 30S ribosomal protein S1 [Desulfovibrio sp.]|nr:30S ribosomal protein S1 [Desulfovibrio sp.]